MTRRVLISGALLALLAAACSAPTPPEAHFGEGHRFLTAVADSQDTVGLAPSVAVAEDGTPYITYLGFPDEVEEGEIAIPRPIGSAFLPAVLLTSVSAEGRFTRGAVAQNQPEAEPNGIEPPFRPAKVPDFDLTPENANGTGIAVAGSGAVHVVWTAANTVSHAVATPPVEGQTATDAVMSTVFELDLPVSQAGPIGKPSVALDSAGAPIVAFGVNDGSRIDINVATQDGDVWDVQTVATAGRCNGCPPPLPTAILSPDGQPIVAYGDPVDGSVRAAVSDGDSWTDEVVEIGADGTGMAATTDGSSTFLTYYSGAGEVRLAERTDDGWSTSSAAETNDPDEVTGVEAATTGVAVHEDTIYVTWQDEEGVQLVEGDGDTFTAVPSSGTTGGITPAVAVSAEGMVTLAWYSPVTQDLRVGFWGELGEIMIANPSPVPTVSLKPTAPASCGEDGQVDLEITGSAENVFDKDCLVAPVDEEITVTFNNEGGTHNFELFPTPDELDPETILTMTPDSTGPATTETDPPVALDEGQYYFQCRFHPSTMNGFLAALPKAK